MMPRTKLALVGLITFAWSGLAEAALIPITGYDITNATISGEGGWVHSYTGTITPISGNQADYSGGTGTMADGIVGTSISTTQLFCGPAPCGTPNQPPTPEITFFLDGFHTLDNIEIFGGDFGVSNSIPGRITGLDVVISGNAASLTTSPFGVIGVNGQPNNDLITLTGTVLAGLATNQLTLSNFLSPGLGLNNDVQVFSIAEVRIFGTAASAVPEPAALTLVGIGLAGVGLMARRRRKAAG